MKAILIDPFKCEVTEVERDEGFASLYPLLSHESMPVDCYTAVHLDDGDAIFVDDEGLLKPCDRYFFWHGYHQALAGRGVICGSDDEGYPTAPKITKEEVESHVIFLERTPDGFRRTTKPWEKPDDVRAKS